MHIHEKLHLYIFCRLSQLHFIFYTFIIDKDILSKYKVFKLCFPLLRAKRYLNQPHPKWKSTQTCNSHEVFLIISLGLLHDSEGLLITLYCRTVLIHHGMLFEQPFHGHTTVFNLESDMDSTEIVFFLFCAVDLLAVRSFSFRDLGLKSKNRWLQLFHQLFQVLEKLNRPTSSCYPTLAMLVWASSSEMLCYFYSTCNLTHTFQIVPP